MAHVTCTCVRTPKRIRASFSFSSEEKERKRGAFQFYCPPYGTISIMKYFGVHFRPPSELHSTYSTIIEIRVGARSLLLGHMIEESWRTPLGHVYTHSWPLSSFLFIPFSLSLSLCSLLKFSSSFSSSSCVERRGTGDTFRGNVRPWFSEEKSL